MSEDWWAVDESSQPGGADGAEWEDPIVAEVRAVRGRLWESAGGTLDGLYALLKASETARGKAMAATPATTEGDARSGSGQGG